VATETQSKSAAAAPGTPSDDASRATSRKRKLVGIVTSDKMNKTRVVLVERRVSHGKYGKYLTKRTKFKAHDEKNEYKTGDKVQIVESRPLSRDKRWRVEKLIERPQEA